MPALETNGASPRGLPLVSVCMTTYNSAAWLQRAIQSVLQQQTLFPCEIVIADDCSTDGTVALARLLQQQHPDVIHVLQRTEKLGMQRNYLDAFEQCRGKYIAWLDADDYWTHPDKLSIQVAALEADDSISACGHFVRQVASSGEVIRKRCPDTAPGRFGLAHIVAENFVPSPSIMFRNGVQRALLNWGTLKGLVDWSVLLQSALAGDLLLLDGVMADYVLTPGSAYMSRGPLYQDELDLEFYRELRQILPAQWQRCIRAAEGKRHEAIAYHLMKLGNLSQARKAARLALRSPHWMDNCVSKIKAPISVEVMGRLAKLRTHA